jgi:predicted nucleic acid-binding protein
MRLRFLKIYVDTSVLGAFFDDNNKYFSETQNLFNRIEGSEQEFFGPTTTIIEFEAMISRNWDQFTFNFDSETEVALNSVSFTKKIQILTE